MKRASRSTLAATEPHDDDGGRAVRLSYPNEGAGYRKARNALLAEENKVGSGLRVFVQGGGCSGFQYGLMIDEGSGDPESDQVFEVNGVRLLVDPVSLRYLKNAEVDFVDNNMGGGFTIKNPNAKSTCGCGSSFNV